MLTLPGWLVILIEQGFIIVTLLAVWFYLRARRFKQRLRQIEEHVGAPSRAQPVRILGPTELKDFGALQERLAISEQRVKNLERFRDMFFDLKDKVLELMATQQTMYSHMQEAGLPLEEQKALLAAYEKLQKEKAQLEQHLSQVDAELEVLLDDARRHEFDVAGKGDATEIIQRQQAEIGRLIQEIADLTLETEAAKRIQATIDQLNLKTGDLIVALEILQDENQFLTEENASLKQQGLAAGDGTDIEALARQLAEKQAEYDTLYEKHLRLESEYLKLQQ